MEIFLSVCYQNNVILILEIHKPMGLSISHEAKIKDYINCGIGYEILVHTSDM